MNHKTLWVGTKSEEWAKNMSSNLKRIMTTSELNMFDHSVTISNELVALESMYLDQHILKHLKRKLKESKVGICTKEQGFVKDLEIKKVQPAEISMSDGSTRFSVTYAVQSMLPKSGKVYTTKKVVVINHDDMCCVISTIDDTCEGKPFQIFIINGVVKGKNYKFHDCKCSIPIVAQPINFVLPNIMVDTVEYYQKQFIVTGKHIHDPNDKKSVNPLAGDGRSDQRVKGVNTASANITKPSVKPSKHDKEVHAKTKKK